MEPSFEMRKLGKQFGCLGNDEITIIISPGWARDLADVFEQRALDAKGYISQGQEREKADFFMKTFWAWERARRELPPEDDTK